MEMDIINHGIDVNNLGISDIGMFASPEKNMKLLTMHGAKGREFDAVAIVDLHEGRVPHFSANTAERINEYRRLLYVSITRARRLLMYITDKDDTRNIPSRFLFDDGLNLISKI
jgi:DNA helicase-2/ATP-dependent DNA helicase PcrA